MIINPINGSLSAMFLRRSKQLFRMNNGPICPQQQNGECAKGQQQSSATTEERLTDVRFDSDVRNSEYIRPMRMHFSRRGHKLSWDLAVEHDNVAALIYHTERRQLLLVKQFRPPVFLHAIRTRPENAGKTVNEINWGSYSIECGHTLELCAGLMDKPGKSPLLHMQEEILEECGYRVPDSHIRPIKRYVTGISISGASQHLFYVELDESMRVSSAGGGNPHEGEFIQNVFLDIAEARAITESDHMVAPPSLLFAISWWLTKNQQNSCGK